MPNYTILLIDYDPRSIEKLRTPLVMAGLRVEVAKDGLAGIKRFNELKPDLTLIEAMIPKKHGFEVCLELKKTPHGQSSAVLIITSVYKGRKYRTQAMHSYRCDEYLEKPITDESLVSIVKRHLPQRAVETHEPAPKAAPSRNDNPLHDVSEDEVLDRLDAMLPDDPVSTPKATVHRSDDAPVEPAPGTRAPDNVVHFDIVRSRARTVLAPEAGPATNHRPAAPCIEPRHFTGGAQHAVAPERIERPHASHAIEPRPAPEAGTAPPRGSASDKRARVYFWIALTLAAALVALLATIIAV